MEVKIVNKEDVKKLYDELLPWDQQEFRDEISGYYDEDYDPFEWVTIGECMEHYGHQNVLEEFCNFELAEQLYDYGGWDELIDKFEDGTTNDRAKLARYIINECPNIVDAIIDNANDETKDLLTNSERDWIYNKGYEVGYREGKEDKQL